MDRVRVNREALAAAGVKLVVLFGSRAQGKERPTSDVDVGVVLDPARTEPTEALRSELAGAFDGPGEVDLVFLDLADPLLLREVAVSGRPLHESAPGSFEEFRVRAIKRYYDTAWIRRIEAEALRRRHA